MKKQEMFIMIMETEIPFSVMDPISDTGISEQSGMAMRSGTEQETKIITEMVRIDQLDMIRWDDEENDSLGFFDWKPAKHPVYGDIEIGGFDPKFLSQNPPAKHLETWIRNEAMFNLEMAKYLPELEWDKIEVKKIKSYKTDSTDYQLKISFRNTRKTSNSP